MHFGIHLVRAKIWVEANAGRPKLNPTINAPNDKRPRLFFKPSIFPGYVSFFPCTASRCVIEKAFLRRMSPIFGTIFFFGTSSELEDAFMR